MISASSWLVQLKFNPKIEQDDENWINPTLSVYNVTDLTRFAPDSILSLADTLERQITPPEASLDPWYSTVSMHQWQTHYKKVVHCLQGLKQV